jgi:hypothetical protein
MSAAIAIGAWSALIISLAYGYIHEERNHK